MKIYVLWNTTTVTADHSGYCSYNENGEYKYYVSRTNYKQLLSIDQFGSLNIFLKLATMVNRKDLSEDGHGFN